MNILERFGAVSDFFKEGVIVAGARIGDALNGLTEPVNKSAYDQPEPGLKTYSNDKIFTPTLFIYSTIFGGVIFLLTKKGK